MKINGIAFKTFAFTSCLMGVVLTISFAILYLILPDYYLMMKKNTLQKNTDAMTAALSKTTSEAEIRDVIVRFSAENNSEVFLYDHDQEVIQPLSFPLVLVEDTVYEDSSMMTAVKGSTVWVQHREEEEERPIQESWVTQSQEIAVTIKQYEMTDADAVDLKRDFFPAIAIAKRNTESDTDIGYVITRKMDHEYIQHMEIFSTLRSVQEARGVILSLIPYLLGIGILISLLASYFYAKRITKPILQISEKAERMQMLQLNIACDLNTKDELGDLSRNIDSLYRSLCMNIETLQSEMHKISQMEKSKTDFMRAASHELKTPIAALNGMLEGMIDNIGVYKDKEKYLKESQSLIQKLGGLVNEILFATKLDEIGQEEIQEEINIGSLIKEILQNHQFMIREKELYIQYPMEKLRYICNQKAFRVVLSNVISNAVSYTHKGGTIAIFYECQENTRILSIENQCDPIAEDDLEKIFEPFFTLEYSRDKKKSGTGLGLYIVKKNLEAMGMKYAFRNIENGVKFEIFLESPC